MFEKAVRTKLRFPYKGACTAEDLWDLAPSVLDDIYRKLRKEQKNIEDDSLLAKATVVKTKLNLQIDIIKYVVQTKLADALARKLAADKKEQKGRILEIIAKKQDESLKDKSIDELNDLLENL